MARVIEFLIAFSAACVSQAAWAECPAGQELFTSCQIADRATEVAVCFDDQIATYRYGPIGGVPELILSESIAQVDFEPWPGVGRSIYEYVTFYNGAFSYQVGGGFERPFSDEEASKDLRKFGWIEIARDGESISMLECRPETVTYGFGEGIYDAKRAAGLEWDDRSKTWVTAGPVAATLWHTDPHAPDARPCLAASEFALGGVMLGTDVAALHKLGSPEATGLRAFNGRLIDRITAPGLEIDLIQNVVVSLTAQTDQWPMPSGLRVGWSRGEVIKHLGQPPNGADPTAAAFRVYLCQSDPDAEDYWSALISFGPDKRVERIRLETRWR